jgi:hypothetical protein
MKKGDVIKGHAHNFDHTSITAIVPVTGSLVAAERPDSAVVYATFGKKERPLPAGSDDYGFRYHGRHRPDKLDVITPRRR